MNNQILTISNEDSADALYSLPESSVDLFVTSPPYDQLRTYGGHKFRFEATARALYRAVKTGGIICWNVGDSVVDGSETLTSFRQAIYFKEVCGFRVHDTMIYEKSNFGHPERRRYHQLFEYVFILSKGEPTTFNPIKDKKNAYGGLTCFGKNTARAKDGESFERPKNTVSEYGMRGNVWRCNTAGQENVCVAIEHPAVMPGRLARDLIMSFSNPGEIVGDPMAGSGTTGREAISSGRRAWLNEINPEYLPIIEKSCTTTAGFAF